MKYVLRLIEHVNQLLIQYVLFFGHRLIQTHDAFEIWARIFSLKAFERSKQGSPGPKEKQRDHTCNNDTLVELIRAKVSLYFQQAQQILRLYT